MITDLPTDEVLPEIDGALTRVHPEISGQQISQLINRLSARYHPEQRQHWAERAKQYYDYRRLYGQLAGQIEHLRTHYEEPA